MGLTRMSQTKSRVATETVGHGVTPAISRSTIRRILVRDTLEPWQHQSWIFIRDPQFAGKAVRVLDLYARRYDGVPLGEDEYVISSDEKHPGPRRRHRTAPAASPRLVGLVGAGVWPPSWRPTASCPGASAPLGPQRRKADLPVAIVVRQRIDVTGADWPADGADRAASGWSRTAGLLSVTRPSACGGAGVRSEGVRVATASAAKATTRGA